MCLVWFWHERARVHFVDFLHRIRALGAWQSIASAPRGDMKSLDLTEFLRFLWCPYDSSKNAWAGILQNFNEKHSVFEVFMLKGLQTQCVWYDFDMNARACTLWCVLQRIRALGAWQSIASAPRGDMKSVDLTKFLRFLWFSYDFRESAWAGSLHLFFKKGLFFF